MQLILEPELAEQLRILYEDMERAYDSVAAQLDHSCNGCPDNCCDSYFLHHTYLEWAYLWQGLGLLSKEQRTVIIEKAYQYERESKAIIEQGERPGIMCPLNEAGKCVLYSHRFMVCRTHGVPLQNRHLLATHPARVLRIAETRGRRSPLATLQQSSGRRCADAMSTLPTSVSPNMRRGQIRAQARRNTKRRIRRRKHARWESRSS